MWFLELKDGYMYAKIGRSDRDLVMSCEGQLKFVWNWMQLAGNGVHNCSTSVGSDCNMVDKCEV